jgi:hypothetical protein
MTSQATEDFIAMASAVIFELEQAISRNDKKYYNAEIALNNVRAWNHLAMAGTLAGSYHPNFGISTSDLMFGPVESKMYELEELYIQKIRDENNAL